VNTRDPTTEALALLTEEIVVCRRCPRLVAHRERVARQRRRQYRDCDYWGRPVPGFGDPAARVVVIGLAPAAHGGNRTGRIFTGDRSGDWLYDALYAADFCNQPTSTHRADGLVLRDAFVTAAVRCAPPDNKPTPRETQTCAPFLVRELALLNRLRVVVALGKFAFDAYLRARAVTRRPIGSPRPVFAHGAVIAWEDVVLLASYHPSQQNTFTGRLTRRSFRSVFRRARQLLSAGD
jgi:uracil-DNA glycosylase family 4